MMEYIPKRGDLITLNFDPQSGHEQRGRRPALVISKDMFNHKTGLCIVCPITSTDRNFPFHVSLPDGLPSTGFVMVEQVKSIDFRSRKVKGIGRITPNLLDEVLSLLDACIY
ncbi:type II toxin-antitoxin system PemK/MazF family toxin [bacterium]|nr:type II toxin-antitoxin system PemK/MazF family toxin [bacterium]